MWLTTYPLHKQLRHVSTHVLPTIRETVVYMGRFKLFRLSCNLTSYCILLTRISLFRLCNLLQGIIIRCWARISLQSVWCMLHLKHVYMMK